MEEYSESFQITDTIVISLETKTVLGKFSKISAERIQIRFCIGYVEVNTERFEPHLSHALSNSLIINEYNILHREVVGMSTYSITKLLG